jgi:hypothetical protein
MGKSTISMAIFNSYVKFPEGINDPLIEVLILIHPSSPSCATCHFKGKPDENRVSPIFQTALLPHRHAKHHDIYPSREQISGVNIHDEPLDLFTRQ